MPQFLRQLQNLLPHFANQLQTKEKLVNKFLRYIFQCIRIYINQAFIYLYLEQIFVAPVCKATSILLPQFARQLQTMDKLG